MVIPGVPHVNGIPGFRDPNYSVFFEATSSWDSVYDGLAHQHEQADDQQFLLCHQLHLVALD